MPEGARCVSGARRGAGALILFEPWYNPANPDLSMKITAYLKPTCGWSRGVRAIMAKYDLPYEDLDIINNPEIYAEMVRKSGQPLSPCVEIDGVMLADVSGEEVENYLLANDIVKPNEAIPDSPTNAACSDEEHARMSAKTIRFF